MWNILAGGGKGVGTGIGAPQMRLFAAAQFNPDFRDRDHDGVYDVNDQVSRSAGRSRRLPGRRRLPRSRQRQRRHPRREGQVPERRRGSGSVRGRGRLPPIRTTTRTASPTSMTRARTPPKTARASDPRTAAPRRPRTATAMASPPTSTSAPTIKRTATASRTRTAAPIPTTTTTASPTTSTRARTTPRTPTALRTRTVAPSGQRQKTGSSTARTSARCRPRRSNGNKDDDGCPDPGAEIVHLAADRITVDVRIGFGSKGGKPTLKESAARSVNLVALVVKGTPTSRSYT